MELDEMKLVLKSKLMGATTERTAGDLQFYVSRKTLSVLGKLKRSIQLELVFATLIEAAFVAGWFFYPYIFVRIFCVLATIFLIFFVLHLLSLYRKMEFYEQFSFSIRETLIQVIQILKLFTKSYFQLSMITLPVVFIIGLLAAYINISYEGLIKNFHWSRGFIFYTICFGAWSLIIYIFSRWYLRNLYGTNIIKLESQLKELENG